MPWTKVLYQKQPSVLDKGYGEGKRILGYAEAIREAFLQGLETDDAVYLMGQGVDDPSGMFGTTKGLQEKFGQKRVFDTPLSEDSLMGVAVGSAISGARPIYLHNRPDFLLLAMDQIVNHASKWRYMFGGEGKVPLVIWACIGRGWGSGAQHSQALQGLFAHVPGVRIVMPSTAYDTKGLLLESISEDNPVIILEHRWLFKRSGFVPQEMYRIPFGKGIIRRQGADVTIVGASQILYEAMDAADKLAQEGIEAEIIDLRTIKPWDKELVLTSLAKTGRLVLIDTGWKTSGYTAEIAATVAEEAWDLLKGPIGRVSCLDTPTPAGYTLEAAFYPGVEKIREVTLNIVSTKTNHASKRT